MLCGCIEPVVPVRISYIRLAMFIIAMDHNRHGKDRQARAAEAIAEDLRQILVECRNFPPPAHRDENRGDLLGHTETRTARGGEHAGTVVIW